MSNFWYFGSRYISLELSPSKFLKSTTGEQMDLVHINFNKCPYPGKETTLSEM